ncbi:hypothetical protein [Streptomyces sp. NPDC056323]|uniref:hypothetical protein n=1 Tax=unclassified Streptomyces TaxID=2593676 RepID=UPI0035DABDBD
MTPTAVSVQRGTTFKEIARILDEFGITAVPVLDGNGCPRHGPVEPAPLRPPHGGGRPLARIHRGTCHGLHPVHRQRRHDGDRRHRRARHGIQEDRRRHGAMEGHRRARRRGRGLRRRRRLRSRPAPQGGVP